MKDAAITENWILIFVSNHFKLVVKQRPDRQDLEQVQIPITDF